jgi:hypothetical protein
MFYHRSCNRCGAPITMRLTWDGWKPFERATYMEHTHRVVRAEPVRRERGVFVPNWPEPYEPRTKQKPPLHERVWLQILGASVLAVILAMIRWLSHN